MRCTILKLNTQNLRITNYTTGFSLGLDDMEGDLSPPIWGGQVRGDKAVIGGTDGEGHILYGGDPYFE